MPLMNGQHVGGRECVPFADLPHAAESTLFVIKSKLLLKRKSLYHLDDTRSSSSTKLTGVTSYIFDTSSVSDLSFSMTTGAQQAMRRTMEVYSNTTRFALACNTSNKIIEPIQSRCAILRYAKLKDAEVLKRLLEIIEMEKVCTSHCFTTILPTDVTINSQVQYNDEGLKALIFTSEGDMRQAINNLQSTWSGFSLVSGTNVFKVCDQPHPILIQSMLQSCEKGDIDAALKSLTDLWDQGYSAVDIVVTIFRVVKQFNA